MTDFWNEHDAIVRSLSRAGAYPHVTENPAQVETHISVVFLAGRFAYKLKKPVKYDFVDYSTAASREHGCREEVRLNRRLAPRAYLGVVPITKGPGGNYRVGGRGRPVDWVVKMRRLPAERMLTALHNRSELAGGDIDRLTARLVRFFQTVEPLDPDSLDYTGLCLAHVKANRAELLAVSHHLPRDLVERIHGFQLQLLRLDSEIFDARVRGGYVIEGHGDLRPEHVCFVDGIVIFDCIEFNRELRTIDIADELSFLAAECDHIGAPWVGPRMLTRYEKVTGDSPPEILLAFYKSFRACVRAKVATLRAEQCTGRERHRAAAEASDYLERADRYIKPFAAPILLIVGGLSGTGKSTLAAALSDALGMELLRTDVIRRELFGQNAGPDNSAVYSDASREVVYGEMLQRAKALIEQGVAVVLDGTFANSATIEAAAEIARGRSSFLAVECQCSFDTALERIRQRVERGRDVSDATPEVLERQAEERQPLPDSVPVLRVSTEVSIQEQLKAIFGALHNRRIRWSDLAEKEKAAREPAG